MMFDGWEPDHGCVGRRWADLAGYRRVFNKKSVENWGTKKWPGLTLNLKESTNSVCLPIALVVNPSGVAKIAKPTGSKL